MRVEVAMFVPAILSVGLLFSLGALARDAVHRLRGRHWLARRAGLDGRESALLVTLGEEAARCDTVGRRPRWLYAVAGIGFTGLALYLAVGSYGNYVGWTGWVESIGWIWLGYLICIVGFGMLGVAVGSIAIWWERPPAWTRPLLSRSPLGHLPPRQPVDAPPVLLISTHEEDLSARERLRRTVQIDERAAETARVIASMWAAVVVVTLSVLAFQDYLPKSKDPSTIELGVSGPVQMGLLAIYAIGSLLASRHEAIGSAIMAAAGAGLAVLSAIQYPTWMAAVIAVALGVPAVLHWLAWQRDRHLHRLVLLAVASLAMVGLVVGLADKLADVTLGPAHPESQTAELPPSAVTWVWAGGTTPSGTTVVAQLADPHPSVRLAVSRSVDLAAPTWTEAQPATDEGERIVRFTVEGLDPSTTYHYAVESDGELDLVRAGAFETFPSGPASYTVAVASCARSGSNGAVYDAIADQDPLFYVQTGDLHYANIDDDDAWVFIDAFASALSTPAQSALYRSTSIAYIWDDHDYGGNDADRTSPSRDAAQEAYRMVVPHYPLHERTDGGPVYQTFTAGRVRYILTDARSERDPTTGTVDPSMLGAEQLAWFEAQLRDAATEAPVVVWINATPWIDLAVEGSDSWGGYAAERTRISTLIDELGLTDRMVMLSGDAHMVAFDDGTNSAYGTGDHGIPVFHAAALDRPGGTKGGPYSDGTFPGAGQFGTMRVDDDGGDTITLTMTGRTWDDRVLLEHELAFDADPRAAEDR